jgi:ubiquinone/menaquinone biosynthesis C-methylase UbiE
MTVSTIDVYRITDELDDPTLDVVVARLEARGKHPRFISMMDQYLQAMDIDSAKTVLDVGCGTGVVARAIARRKGFAGRVIGIDVASYLIAAAKRLAEEEGVASAIEFRTGDSHGLQLSDAVFDAAVAHTLVSHVSDPLAVLKEIARVVRPGGTVGIFDGDYASMTFGSDDPEKGKADDAAIIDAIVTNPRILRQMPQLLREAGLELVASFGNVVADIGKADFWAPAIESFLRLVPKSGAMTDSEIQLWATSMRQRSEQGIFFGASNYYAYVARRR